MGKIVEKAVKKRKERIAVSEAYYREGVEEPSKDWLEEFKKAKDRRNAGLRKAMEEGLFEKGAERVGTDGWQKATLAKADRWLSGASSEEANEKYESAMADVEECIERARKAVEGMPTTTVEQRAEKSKRFQIEMAKCMEEKKKRR
ncbi:MAG: hypothetical protein OBKJMPBA_00001 [Methanophagales virus PBV304]|uniref:Uncharacterized protein n=1 Tax=Methanophagales virus PBV304 TaxID=3071309 RepID=A0AA46YJC0_9VIRU|nr:MAG: hypothetical protein QIT47_gp01 [Methanophagales virus PBV304]UYL65033.1 MAG: hypothetical protein OBKJMPBA_00001 [Methanophagales virus PBV304]